MSAVEKIIDMVDSSSKNDDPIIYRLNLLSRTLKTDDKAMQMINRIHSILSMRSTVPLEIAKIWEEAAVGLMGGLIASSSEKGWFLNSVTQHKIKYSVDSPDAKKMMHSKTGLGEE